MLLIVRRTLIGRIHPVYNRTAMMTVQMVNGFSNAESSVLRHVMHPVVEKIIMRERAVGSELRRREIQNER